MAEENTFPELLRRVRSGDQEAAAELVRQYEPLVRVEARLRLTAPRLRRPCDSMDICQSVLGSFFIRTAAGQYDLERPEQLVLCLVQTHGNAARPTSMPNCVLVAGPHRSGAPPWAATG